MKTLSIFLALLLAIGMTAQTPYSVFQTTKETSEVSTESASVNNAWLGGKATGTFGSGDLSENLLLAGKIIYDMSIGKLKMPIVSNVSFNFNDATGTGFVFGDKGISIGVYPYHILSQKDKVTWVLHGGLAYKLLPQETFKVTPQQTRIFAGLELAYAAGDARYPLTISVTPLYTINNLDNSNMFAFETTAVLPVTGGLGILAELTNPFKKGVESVFKIGVIVNSKL